MACMLDDKFLASKRLQNATCVNAAQMIQQALDLQAELRHLQTASAQRSLGLDASAHHKTDRHE